MKTNGAWRVKVNALLNEASSKLYLNSDVAAELRLEGSPHELMKDLCIHYRTCDREYASS